MFRLLVLTALLIWACAPLGAGARPSATTITTPAPGSTAAAPTTSAAATPTAAATLTATPTETATPTFAPLPWPTSTPLGSSTPVPLPSSVGIYAPSADAVWAIVGGTRLFRSTDRGGTWTERVLSPRDLTHAGPAWDFTSATDCRMLAIFQPGTQCQQQDTELWHTTDGALSWQQIDPHTLPFFQCKRGLTFVDALRSYVTAADTTNRPTVHRTIDGARTWTSARLPSPPARGTPARRGPTSGRSRT